MAQTRERVSPSLLFTVQEAERKGERKKKKEQKPPTPPPIRYPSVGRKGQLFLKKLFKEKACVLSKYTGKRGNEGWEE